MTCWTPKFQFTIKGVLRFGSTAPMLHGFDAVQESPPPCGKTTLFQARAEPGKAAVPSWTVPPKVCPVGQLPPVGIATLQAPVGTAARRVEVEFWSPSCPPNWPWTSVEYMMLAPPRNTVVPLPVTSQAKPKRG